MLLVDGRDGRWVGVGGYYQRRYHHPVKWLVAVHRCDRCDGLDGSLSHNRSHWNANYVVVGSSKGSRKEVLWDRLGHIGMAVGVDLFYDRVVSRGWRAGSGARSIKTTENSVVASRISVRDNFSVVSASSGYGINEPITDPRVVSFRLAGSSGASFLGCHKILSEAFKDGPSAMLSVITLS